MSEKTLVAFVRNSKVEMWKFFDSRPEAVGWARTWGNRMDPKAHIEEDDFSDGKDTFVHIGSEGLIMNVIEGGFHS